MRRKTGRAAIFTAAVISASMLMSTVAMAAQTVDTTAGAAEDTVELVAVSCEEEDAWTQVAVVDAETAPSGVNIRSEAEQDSDILGYLYEGTAAWVIDKGDEWTEFYSNGITGYVKNEYLLYDASAEEAAEENGIEGVRTSWDDVEVYTSTAADDVETTLDAGTSYQLVSDDGEWAEIQYDEDTTAFISDDAVTKVLLLEPATPKDGERIELSAVYSSAYRESSAAKVSGSEESYARTDYAENAEETYNYEEYEEEYADADESVPEDAYFYEETAYEESGEADYEESYEETYEVSYEETWEAEPDSYEETYVETVTASGSDELDALWQAYLDAQAAADAATLQADEQLVYDTYNAAVAAYQAYLNALNGTSTEAAYAEPTETYVEYVEETEAYVEETEAYVEETEAYVEETEAASTSASADDLTLLASIIYCEAGNQSYEGMVAVGAVVMNRVYSSSFPNTISEVIYQSGQFTPASNGMLSSALANGVGDTYYSAAQDALAGTDPTGGCLYFNTSHGSGLKIGAHWFY